MRVWLNRALMSVGTMALTTTVASAGSTVGLPYEEPGLLIVESLTGTGAFIISALAIVGGVATIMFSNNISDVARWFCIAGIGIGILVGVIAFLATAFGVTGAELAMAYPVTELRVFSVPSQAQVPYALVAP